jgi:LysM repeat protein
VQRAANLKRGFAGFHTPANMLLAETALICDSADRATIDEMTSTALRTAHNIQDESFCLRMTSRCNAMVQRWWNTSVDQETSVRLLATDPRAAELTALHNVGERFGHRAPGGLLISLPVQQAASLEAIANIYHRPLAEVERVNPHVDPRQPLAEGTQVNVPDPGFATWIAARLSAGLLADVTLLATKRSELIQLLVPVASPNRTILDTVLARMLLAARPSDSQTLQALAILAGPAQMNGVLPAKLRKAVLFKLSFGPGGGGRRFGRCEGVWRSRIC